MRSAPSNADRQDHTEESPDHREDNHDTHSHSHSRHTVVTVASLDEANTAEDIDDADSLAEALNLVDSGCCELEDEFGGSSHECGVEEDDLDDHHQLRNEQPLQNSNHEKNTKMLWLVKQSRNLQENIRVRRVELDLMEQEVAEFQKVLAYTCRVESAESLHSRLAMLRRNVETLFASNIAQLSDTDQEGEEQRVVSWLRKLQSERIELEKQLSHIMDLEKILQCSSCGPSLGVKTESRLPLSADDIFHRMDALSNSDTDDTSIAGAIGMDYKSIMPNDGYFYEIRTGSDLLFMLYKPRDLIESLLAIADAELVHSLGERPVVAFLSQDSKARTSEIGLGHVLLRVNGVDVLDPDTAHLLLLQGTPDPLDLLFYVPNTPIVSIQGQYIVHYKNSSPRAPFFKCMWKTKFLVVGGIHSRPWLIRMYRSKVCLSSYSVTGCKRFSDSSMIPFLSNFDLAC